MYFDWKNSLKFCFKMFDFNAGKNTFCSAGYVLTQRILKFVVELSLLYKGLVCLTSLIEFLRISFLILMRYSSVAKLPLGPSMLSKNERGDPSFLLHFSNIHNMITNWMKFEKIFRLFLLSAIALNSQRSIFRESSILACVSNSGNSCFFFPFPAFRECPSYVSCKHTRKMGANR